MRTNRTAAALAETLAGPGALLLPGAYDPLSAKLVEEAGFGAVYVGSYAAAAAGYGLPDVGALTLDEIVRHARVVVDAVSVPVVADAEGGFFEPGNIWRTIDAFERAGVAAIHIEDHAGGKHTTLPQKLIPLEAMKHKLHAALDARRSKDLAIIARTDAIWATRNLDEAIVRLKAFEDVGVDYLFPTGATPDMLRHIRTHVRTKIITINLASVADPSDWDGAADLVIDYGFCLRAATKALKDSLKPAKQRKPEAFGPWHLESEADFEARLGYADFTRRAEKYR